MLTSSRFKKICLHSIPIIMRRLEVLEAVVFRSVLRLFKNETGYGITTKTFIPYSCRSKSNRKGRVSMDQTKSAKINPHKMQETSPLFHRKSSRLSSSRPWHPHAPSPRLLCIVYPLWKGQRSSRPNLFPFSFHSLFPPWAREEQKARGGGGGYGIKKKKDIYIKRAREWSDGRDKNCG